MILLVVPETQYSHAHFLRLISTRHVKILVSNDDGYRAEGIRRLREALATLAEVTVVAPDRNRSGASNSLTLDVPAARVRGRAGRVLRAGHADRLRAPGDLGPVRLRARHGGLGRQRRPESGRRRAVFGHGGGSDRGPLPGTADDRGVAVYHARRRRLTSRPARKWRACSWRSCCKHPLRAGADPERQRSGRAVREAARASAPAAWAIATAPSRSCAAQDPRGRPVYWVGPAGAEQDAGPGTDFDAGRRRASCR